MFAGFWEGEFCGLAGVRNLSSTLIGYYWTRLHTLRFISWQLDTMTDYDFHLPPLRVVSPSSVLPVILSGVTQLCHVASEEFLEWAATGRLHVITSGSIESIVFNAIPLKSTASDTQSLRLFSSARVTGWRETQLPWINQATQLRTAMRICTKQCKNTKR